MPVLWSAIVDAGFAMLVPGLRSCEELGAKATGLPTESGQVPTRHYKKGRPELDRAFRLIGESGDGYLVELEVAATAWALTASSGTTPSCCIRPRASQLT